MHGKDAMDGIPFTLMTPFPRKIFTDEDMEAPIKVLGTFSDVDLINMFALAYSSSSSSYSLNCDFQGWCLLQIWLLRALPTRFPFT